jgi:glutamate carboxypeptidase
MTTLDELALIKEKAALYQPRQLELLKDLVSVDSRTGHFPGNLKVIERIEKELIGLRAKVERREAKDLGFHLVARCGSIGAKSKILCLAHIDTVYEPGLAALHPFRVDGERAYGLGVADCKGGVVVALHAVSLAMELGLFPKDTELTLIFNCDEERGSPSSRELIKEEALGASAGFVFEPSRDEDGVITSRRGKTYGSIEVKGRSAPAASSYWTGADANKALVGTLSDLYDYNHPDGNLTFNVGLVSGGQKADQVSESARAEFFVTFADEWELWHVNRALQTVGKKNQGPGLELTVQTHKRSPAFERDQRVVKLYLDYREAAVKLGYEPMPEQKSTNSSDACWCSLFNLPVIDALGPYMFSIHNPDESILISSLAKRTAIFALTLGLIKRE